MTFSHVALTWFSFTEGSSASGEVPIADGPAEIGSSTLDCDFGDASVSLFELFVAADANGGNWVSNPPPRVHRKTDDAVASDRL